MELSATFSEYVEWMSVSHSKRIDYQNETTGVLPQDMEEKIYRLATSLLRHSLLKESDSDIILHIRLGEGDMVHIDYQEEGGFDTRILDQIHSSFSSPGGFALVRTRPDGACSIDLKLRQTDLQAG